MYVAQASLFCILMMQCVYTRDCYCSWCVCVSTSPSRCCQCLGTRPYFYSSGTVLFTLQFRTVPCHAGTGVETVPSWHGCTCQCKRSISFVYINILRTMCNWRQHSLIWCPSIPDFYVLFFVYTNSHLVALLPSLSKPTASKLYIVASQHSPKTVDQQCC